MTLDYLNAFTVTVALQSVLWKYIYYLLQYNIHRNLPVSMKNSIILLLCIFEQSVQAGMYKVKGHYLDKIKPITSWLIRII